MKLKGTTTVITDDNGVATFPDLVLSGNAVTKLQYTVGNLVVESDAITVYDAININMQIIQQPTLLAVSNSTLPIQPIVKVPESSKLKSQPTEQLLVTAKSSNIAFSLQGTISIAINSQDVATFTDLKLLGEGFTSLVFTLVSSLGTATVTSDQIQVLKSSENKLYNFPNPFEGITNIKYNVDQRSKVTIEVFNLGGANLLTVYDNYRDKGEYIDPIDGSKFPQGIYVVRLKVDGIVQRSTRITKR